MAPEQEANTASGVQQCTKNYGSNMFYSRKIRHCLTKYTEHRQ